MSLHGMSTPTNKLIALTLAFKLLQMAYFLVYFSINKVKYS